MVKITVPVSPGRCHFTQCSRHATYRRAWLIITIASVRIACVTSEREKDLLRGIHQDAIINLARLGKYGVFNEYPWLDTDAVKQ